MRLGPPFLLKQHELIFMAVEAFVGLVGGGKSFNSVRRMMAYMAQGGRCCSNILLTGWEVDNRRFRDDSPVLSFLRSIGWEYQPGQYTYIPYDDMLRDFSWIKRVPAGVDRDHRTLLVVDEATDLFDSLDGGRLRVDSQYRDIFHFLRLSRHVHVDVLFIAQDINSINTRLRGLVAYIWRSTDMKKFRLAKLKIPFPFDLFMLQQFDKSGHYEVKREWVKKDYRVFDLYDSEAFNNSLSVKWDGVSVSHEKGQINNKGKKKMTKLQMIILLASFVLSGVAFFRSSRPARSSAVSPSQLSVVSSNQVSVSSFHDSPPTSSNEYLRGSYVYKSSVSNCHPWVVFRGLPIRMGVPCEFGYPTRLTATHSILSRQDGSLVFLLPQEDEIKSSFNPVSINVYRGEKCRRVPAAPF